MLPTRTHNQALANPNSRRARRLPILLATAFACAAFLSVIGTAQAATPIEGIWSFNGGTVGIQAQPDGSYVGTVVSQTKFDRCTHPVGQQMWTGMREQPDGSFWGSHQWYYSTSESPCTLEPLAGPTAWRVLSSADGSHFLRVCFSDPQSGSQPTIAADGSSANASFGCFDSALIAPLPALTQAEVGKSLSFPKNEGCLGRKRIRIRIHDPENDPFEEIVVTLKSGKTVRTAKVKRQGSTATAILDLSDLTNGSFSVRVKLTTVLGEHFVGKRTYSTCTKAKRLHPPKVHHGG